MKRSLIVTLVTMLFSVVVGASPASARHPHDEGRGCGLPNSGALYISGDGEAWICTYDPYFELYYWEPVSPGGGDSEVDTRGAWSLPYDDWHMLLSRTEWIRGSLKTGTDVYVRHPRTQPSYRSAGQIAAFSRLWHWSGSTWNVCRDSGWRYTSFVTESLVPTFDWGSSPCGSGYYGSHAYGAHLANGQWLVSGAQWSGYLYANPFLGRAALDGKEMADEKPSAPDQLPNSDSAVPPPPQKVTSPR